MHSLVLHFTSVRIWGNGFHVGDSTPPWEFPLETAPIDRNIGAPPTTQSSAIENENYPSYKESGHKKKRLTPGGIAFMVGGVTMVATCAALVIVIHIKRSRAQKLKQMGSGNSSPQSLPVNTARGKLNILSSTV